MKAKNWPLGVMLIPDPEAKFHGGANYSCRQTGPHGFAAFAFWNAAWVNGTIEKSALAIYNCEGRSMAVRGEYFGHGHRWIVWPVREDWQKGHYQWPSEWHSTVTIDWVGDANDPRAPGHRAARIAIRKALYHSWAHAISRAGNDPRAALYRMQTAARAKARDHHADVVIRDDGLFFVASEGETRIDHPLDERERARAVQAAWERARLKWDSR